MRRILVWALIFIFECACNKKADHSDIPLTYPISEKHDALVQEKLTQEVIRKDRSFFKQTLLDSMQKYHQSDSMLIHNPQYEGLCCIFMGKCNNKFLGVLILEDSIYMYDHDRRYWMNAIATNGRYYDRVRFRDLNGDGHQDIDIWGYEGTAANEMSKVLLYIPSKEKFQHNLSYDLPNLHYDQTTNRIISSSRAGMVHCQSFSSYIVTVDSLMPDMKIIYCPQDTDSASVEYTYFKDGRLSRFNKRIGKKTEIWNTYKQESR